MLKAVEEDLRLLIKRKLELYPDIKKTNSKCAYSEIDGKNSYYSSISYFAIRFSTDYHWTEILDCYN